MSPSANPGAPAKGGEATGCRCCGATACETVPTLVQLPTGKALTVRGGDVFLDSLGNPNTVRNYAIGVGKTAEWIGEGRPLASVADDEIGEALELLWGTSVVNTRNSRRVGVLSWLGWCRERGYGEPAVLAWAKRLAVPDSHTPARSKMAVDRLIARCEVHLCSGMTAAVCRWICSATMSSMNDGRVQSSSSPHACRRATTSVAASLTT